MQRRFMTLPRHIQEGEKLHPEATGELSAILNQMGLAAKVISLEVNKAGLVDIIGFTGDKNVHGEQVKKLDMFAHDIIIRALDHTGHFCVMASEEEEDIIHIPEKHKIGKYVILFDPLDGSSNIDANVSIGTIFSVYKRITPDDGQPGTLEDCLQPGVKQVAAGYIVYGSSTIFVYTAGHGVHGFTLDPAFGEFLLSHENIESPPVGNIYSLNEGNYKYWHPGLKKYIKHLQAWDNSKKPYKARYIGSMVADIHRNLFYGGIFMYPGDKRNPNGKLRLMYECNPMAFIVESAGGKATDGNGKRILEYQPNDLHQRVPIYIGSKEDVELVEKFISEEEVVEKD
ncbi:MAG: class 1 fructose-bisphosphatase [Melioribacteraceae bacterium]|nr:class 1 fructose-bisphosphatase [Melioribacteraceae bacterium]MCF8353701.1 class 1 fructose-bisphosphatase [Melioribacteraceae bacterium]MCF8396069.1 class 1 fructose-bisphosphatase [Melioribacteraceae bacterium]MCF8418617.1 class 1 fructose-bisphosphatase [Melioribacteraceae bacterium]